MFCQCYLMYVYLFYVCSQYNKFHTGLIIYLFFNCTLVFKTALCTENNYAWMINIYKYITFCSDLTYDIQGGPKKFYDVI